MQEEQQGTTQAALQDRVWQLEVELLACRESHELELQARHEAFLQQVLLMSHNKTCVADTSIIIITTLRLRPCSRCMTSNELYSKAYELQARQ